MSIMHEDHVKVVVATSAFGLGIDHQHIRCIIIYELPDSVAALTQMIGRAGRDLIDAGIFIMYNFAIYNSFKVNLNKTITNKKKEGVSKETITAMKENATSDFFELIITMECTDWCRHDSLNRSFSEEMQPIFCRDHCDNCVNNDDARNIEFPFVYEKIHNFIKAHSNTDRYPTLKEAVTHLGAYGLYNAPHDLCQNDYYGCLITLPKRWISRLVLNAIAMNLIDYEIMENASDDDFGNHLVLKPKMFFDEMLPAKLPIRDTDQVEYKSKKHYIMELTRRALWRLFKRYSSNDEAMSIDRVKYAYNDIVQLQPFSREKLNKSVLQRKADHPLHFIHIKAIQIIQYLNNFIAVNLDKNIIKLQLQELSRGISDTSMISVRSGRRSFRDDLKPKYQRMFADIDACDDYNKKKPCDPSKQIYLTNCTDTSLPSTRPYDNTICNHTEPKCRMTIGF
ncbi:hypothetical protein TKK_0003872 [Trichogramma kaykai]